MIFFTVSFSRFTPSRLREGAQGSGPQACALFRVVGCSRFRQIQDKRRSPLNSRCASGRSLHAGASFKVDTPHSAAWNKGPENRKNELKLFTLCAAQEGFSQ